MLNEDMRQRNALDLLFWIALIVLLFWASGKMLGLISSPAWIEMIPVFSAVFMAGTLWQKITNMFADVRYIKKVMAERFSKLEHEHSLVMSGKLKVKH